MGTASDLDHLGVLRGETNKCIIPYETIIPGVAFRAPATTPAVRLHVFLQDTNLICESQQVLPLILIPDISDGYQLNTVPEIPNYGIGMSIPKLQTIGGGIGTLRYRIPIPKIYDIYRTTAVIRYYDTVCGMPPGRK